MPEQHNDPSGAADPQGPPVDAGEAGSKAVPVYPETKWSHPVVSLATGIVISLILLIGAAVLGLDQGVLQGMAGAGFARGLITYLFAVVTIGTAVVLVVSALTTPNDEVHQEQFNRGKEILSLLLGVFGTIVGYYFGAANTEANQLSLSALDASPRIVAPGAVVRVAAFVAGGVLPYRYAAGIGDDDLEPNQFSEATGIIVIEVTARALTDEEESRIRLVVEDAAGAKAEATTPISVRAP